MQSPTDVRANALAAAAVLIAAVLQVLTPLLPLVGMGLTIEEMSDSARTLITPAGWAFSIWGLLYLGSAVFAIYQILPCAINSRLIEGTRWPAACAFAGNALWAAYVQVSGLTILSVVIIAMTLASLLVIYRRFSGHTQPLSRGELWFAFVPLSALTSWLTVATIVNVAAALRFHGVEAGGYTPMLAAFVLLLGGAIGGTAIFKGRGNLPFTAVFLWAMAAIYAAGGQSSSAVAIATGIVSLGVVFAVILGWRRPASASMRDDQR